MARTQKPRAIKELQGTLQKSRDKKTMVDIPLVSVLPVPLIPLSQRAMMHRESIADKLLKYKIMTELDIDALDIYAHLYDTYIDCLEQIKKTPMKHRFVATSERGKIKNPIFSIQRSLFDQLHACQIKLGLTPADRTKINAEIAENKEENPYAKMQAITASAEKPKIN